MKRHFLKEAGAIFALVALPVAWQSAVAAPVPTLDYRHPQFLQKQCLVVR